MLKVYFVLSSFIATTLACGMGTVNFATAATGVNAPVTNCLTGQRVAGTAFKAQLFYDDPSTTADDVIDQRTAQPSMTPVFGIASFTSNNASGYITTATGGGTRALIGVAGGSEVTLQIRAWEASLGTTYEEALTAWQISDGTKVLGNSKIFTVITGNPPLIGPAPLTGANPGWFICTPPVVEFANFGATLDAPITNALTGRRVEGPSFVAQLYVGRSGAEEPYLVPNGPPVPFRDGETGYFSGGRRVNGFVNGQTGTFQVRVWNSAGGATYEDALSAGQEGNTNAVLGKSAVFENGTGPSIDSPAVLTNLQSFVVARVPPTPLLQITRSPLNARIIWSTNANGFVLEIYFCACARHLLDCSNK